MAEGLSQRQDRLSSESNHAFAPSQLIELTACFANLFHLQNGRTGFPWNPDGLRMVVDQLLIVARRYGIDMEKAVWGKYPKLCSYCTEPECVCGIRKSTSAKQLELPIPTGETLSLEYLQNMLARIYPRGRHQLHETVTHVVEEIGETLDAISAGDRPKAEREFADIFAWMMQVANHLGITLAETDRPKPS